MFQSSVPGKWILTGEHSVVRGQRALVFPLSSKSLRLRFLDGSFAKALSKQESNPMLLDALKTAAKGAQKFLAEKGQKKQAKKIASNFQFPVEKFTADSTIPIGSGLGSSAALCVALAKWFAHKGYIYEEELYDLALEMEHAFHGKSSGMDVAVALSMQPLEFHIGKSPKPFTLGWQPHIYLFDSGERSSTKESVLKVMEAYKSNETRGKEIDAKMQASVDLAFSALTGEASPANLSSLKQSFDLGRDCYEEWALLTPQMQARASLVTEAGAIAWKPTGSGAGGFLLALFPEPIESTQFEFEVFSGF